MHYPLWPSYDRHIYLANELPVPQLTYSAILEELFRKSQILFSFRGGACFSAKLQTVQLQFYYSAKIILDL